MLVVAVEAHVKVELEVPIEVVVEEVNEDEAARLYVDEADMVELECETGDTAVDELDPQEYAGGV